MQATEFSSVKINSVGKLVTLSLNMWQLLFANQAGQYVQCKLLLKICDHSCGGSSHGPVGKDFQKWVIRLKLDPCG